MTNATSTTPMAASRVTKSAHLDDVEDPKSTEDALGLLADADSYFQLAQEWEVTAPATAASYREKARQLQAAAAAFLQLPEGRPVGSGGELSIPTQETLVCAPCRRAIPKLHAGRRLREPVKARLLAAASDSDRRWFADHYARASGFVP